MTSDELVTDRSGMIAKMAMELCGTKYRLHGRNAEHGLDCVGLAARCLSSADLVCDVPNGYSMRGGSAQQISEVMTLAGFFVLPSGARLREGDIALVRPGPVQWHLMIRTDCGFVHAHAGLGKVVLTPGEAQWPIEMVFRIGEN